MQMQNRHNVVVSTRAVGRTRWHFLAITHYLAVDEMHRIAGTTAIANKIKKSYIANRSLSTIDANSYIVVVVVVVVHTDKIRGVPAVFQIAG